MNLSFCVCIRSKYTYIYVCIYVCSFYIHIKECNDTNYTIT